MKTDSWDGPAYRLFELQTIKAVGLEGHPKAEELYALAWHYGYQGGPDEVLHVLADLAEMELGHDKVE